MRRNGIIFVALGIAAGLLTGYLRAFSPMSFWTFSDLAARYGFWIVTVSAIACLAKSGWDAFYNSLFYMAAMCVAYYAYLYAARGAFYGKQFLLWGAFSVAASVFAKWLHQAVRMSDGGEWANIGDGAAGGDRAPAPDRRQREKHTLPEFLIPAVPLVLLGIECADLWYLFLQYRTDFLQLLIDTAGVALLFALFAKKKDGAYRKRLLCLALFAVCAVCVTFLVLWSL